MTMRFSDGNIEYRFTEKNLFFHFCNFVFSVQFAIFIRLIYLFYASMQLHSARLLLLYSNGN